MPFRREISNLQTSDGSNIAFSYRNDQVTSKTYSGPFSSSILMTYFADGRHLSSMTVAGSSVPLVYNSDRELFSAGELFLDRDDIAAGLLTSKRLGTITERMTYNEFGEMITRTFDGNSLGDSYVRDALGRVTEYRTNIGNSPQTSTYIYDPAGQLVRAVVTGADPRDTQYTYDQRGNRVSVIRNGTVTSASFDEEDRLLSFGDLRFTYTDHGDLLSKTNILTNESLTLTYDQRGQLTRAVIGNGSGSVKTITYTIDGEGRRLTKSVNGVFTTGYMYDMMGRLVAEVEPSGALRSHFVYGSQSHSPDYMIRANGARYFFVKNHIGTIQAVINASTGVADQTITQDEFGRVLNNSNPSFQPFGFAGGHCDFETGLVRFGARDYDPQVGRWTAKDPILFDGAQTNLYSYVANDPINWIDPEGEFLIAPVLIGAAFGGTIEAASQLVDNGGNIQCLDWRKIGQEAAVSAALGGALGNVGKFGKIGRRIGRLLQNALKNTPLGPGGWLNQGAFRVGIGSHNGEQIIRIGLPGNRNHIDLLNLGPK